MSSRFVAAGTNENPASLVDDDGWAKARQQVDSVRKTKPEDKGKQEDGKSLYEVLQANKVAKQEAFEEAARLKNQFRTLDDSEVAFLESVHENARMKDDAAKRETAEQVEIFRKQRAAAEQAVMEAAQASGAVASSADTLTTGSWNSSRKRRRVEKLEDVVPATKQRKASTSKNDSVMDLAAAPVQTKTTTEPENGKQQSVSHPHENSMKLHQSATASGLGLDAYSSDDD